MKRFLLALPFAIMLAGCQTTNTVMTPILQDRPAFVPPPLTAAKQSPVNWIVLNKGNAAEKIAELEKSDGVVAVFALTPRGYENLSINVAELRRYIQQQNAIIAAMRQYYETPVGEPNANK